MANVGGPYNNQHQPDLQAFENAAERAGKNNAQIKVDRNTGNVGTRSLFGRAWRAVSPAFSGRRESNMSDIESFKKSLLEQNNEQSHAGNAFARIAAVADNGLLPADVAATVEAVVKEELDPFSDVNEHLLDDVREKLDNFLSDDVEKALDKFLPGYETGKVPLTAGAVRRSIEYLDLLRVPIRDAVDNPRLEFVIEEQRADEIANFYREASDMLKDGGFKIEPWQFESFVSRYVSDPAIDNDNAEVAPYSYGDVYGQDNSGDRPIELSVELRNEMLQFVEDNDEDALQYNDRQLEEVRDLLSDAKKQAGSMLVGDGLSKFKGYIGKRRAEQVEKIGEEEMSTTSFSEYTTSFSE